MDESLKSVRLKLQNELSAIMLSINPEYEKRVFYRAPSFGVKYPCIMYDLSGERNRYSCNKEYNRKRKWIITIVDTDPDSEIPEKIKEKFMYYQFDRVFIADGLNHFVCTLYY